MPDLTQPIERVRRAIQIEGEYMTSVEWEIFLEEIKRDVLRYLKVSKDREKREPLP
jgi:hypothetical protein